MPSLKQGRIPLDEAQAIAVDLRAELIPYCYEIQVAGSIRRERPDVGDIDLVCIPMSYEISVTDMFGTVLSTSPVLETLKHLQELEDVGIVQISKSGAQIVSFTYRDMACDLYQVSDQTAFPTIYLVRTGSENWNRFLACLAINQGKKFKVNGQGIVCQGERVGYLSEEHILEAVGLPFIPPKERDVPLSALRAELDDYFEHFREHQTTMMWKWEEAEL